MLKAMTVPGLGGLLFSLLTFHLVKTPGQKKTNMSSSGRFPLKPTGTKYLKQMEVSSLRIWLNGFHVSLVARSLGRSLGSWFSGENNITRNATGGLPNRQVHVPAFMDICLKDERILTDPAEPSRFIIKSR